LKKKLEFRNDEDGEFFMTYEDFYHYFDVVEICFPKFPYPLLKLKSQASCLVTVARKHPRLQPVISSKQNYLSFQLDPIMLVNFQNFKKMLELISKPSKSDFNQVIYKNGELLPAYPRCHYQLSSSQFKLYRLASHEEEFLIRIYICCQLANSSTKRLRCIYVHIKINGNSIEFDAQKCKCVKFKTEEYCNNLLQSVIGLKSIKF
jgi:hypothetical protein